MTWIYKKKTHKQLKNWFNDKMRKGRTGFLNFDDFKNWYDGREKVCFYCGLSEAESQKIVHNGLLVSVRFPLKGKLARGINRGYWLEIDRKNPKGIYSGDNCELACYFCNNDKSDVFSAEQYHEFIKNRSAFLKNILNNIK